VQGIHCPAKSTAFVKLLRLNELLRRGFLVLAWAIATEELPNSRGKKICFTPPILKLQMYNICRKNLKSHVMVYLPNAEID
jgi:hypothetical protein